MASAHFLGCLFPERAWVCYHHTLTEFSQKRNVKHCDIPLQNVLPFSDVQVQELVKQDRSFLQQSGESTRLEWEASKMYVGFKRKKKWWNWNWTCLLSQDKRIPLRTGCVLSGFEVLVHLIIMSISPIISLYSGQINSYPIVTENKLCHCCFFPPKKLTVW